jgi:hypothetical protein
MDRIKGAIERAKAEQGGPSATMGWAPRPLADDLEQIEYRQTRVVRLDPEQLERHRIVSFDPTDSRCAVFDLLRTQVARSMREHGWRSLAVVSPTERCGKTFVAINLAASLAQQASQTVLLADFDLRRPKIAEYLGLKCQHSLVELAERRAELSSALVNPGIPRLVILPNSAPVSRAAEFLTSTKARSLVSDLKAHYESRVVLFDLPPLLPNDDAISFLSQVDCVLLVVTQGLSTESDVKESLRLLKPFHLLGTVLNKSDSTTKKYGKNY